MANSPQPVVPPELCDAIIDYLHDDPRTLAICALVCQAWVHASRMHQFHTIVLHRFLQWRGQKLSLISDHSSTVLPYVRHLALGEGRGRPYEPYWLNDALPDIRADDLVGLQTFELFEANLGKLSPKATRQLHTLCRRPKTVAFRSFGFGHIPSLLNLFQSCVSAEKFVALGSYEGDAELTVASFEMPPHLQTLVLDGFMFDFMQALRRFEPRHSIRYVDIASIYPGRAGDIARFLQWCGPTVEEVILDFPDPRIRIDLEDPEFSFCAAGGLKDNTSLRAISLTGSPSQLLPVLEQIKSNVVECVSINTAPYAVDSLNFRALVALFSGGPFASARLRVLSSDIEVQPIIAARDKVYANLHELREQGRLVFERAGGYPIDPSTPPITEAKWGPPFPYTSLVLDHYVVPSD